MKWILGPWPIIRCPGKSQLACSENRCGFKPDARIAIRGGRFCNQHNSRPGKQHQVCTRWIQALAAGRAAMCFNQKTTSKGKSSFNLVNRSTDYRTMNAGFQLDALLLRSCLAVRNTMQIHH